MKPRIGTLIVLTVIAAISLGTQRVSATPPPPQLSVLDLGTLGSTYSSANDINEHGQVVGNSAIASGEDRAFLW